MPLPSFLGPFVDVPAAPAAQLAANRPPGGAGAPHILTFTMQDQQQTEWCWAATAASVSAYYNVAKVWTQCEVASQCLGMDCCIIPLPPPPPPYWAGNRMYTLDFALNVIQHLASGPTGDVLTFSSITDEIKGGRPVCCHISWGHFNVIVGYYDDSNQDIVVRDPLHGEQTLPYAMFVSSYYGGAWDDSYLTS